MGQRNTLSTHQMLDLESEQGGVAYLHPNHFIHFGKVGDYPNQNMYPVQSVAGSASGFDHRFAVHHGGNVLYGNQHNSVQQYYHPLSNIYHPYMLNSSSRSFPVLLNNGSASLLPSPISPGDSGILMHETGKLDSLRRSFKSKEAEVVPGGFYHVNGPANYYKYAVPFAQPEYQGRVICPTTNGPDRRVRSSSTSNCLRPPEPAIPHHHHSSLIQGNFMGHPSQASSSAWVEQPGNHFADGGCSSSNYTDVMTYMHGTSINSGAVEIPQPFVAHRPPMHSFYQQLPPMQSIPVSAYSHHGQAPLPSFLHPLNNRHTNNVHRSRDELDTDSSFRSPFPSIPEPISTPSLHESVPEIIHGNFRILSEDAAAAALQIPQYYGLEEISDQHRDMRLDIDDMSYEELLALEERIGVVNTGLPDESILKNLKTSSLAPQTTCSQLDESSQLVLEKECCIICQVEYEEIERIGTLDCGHGYHTDCIRQWLQVKNLCPICKKPGLATDRREG